MTPSWKVPICLPNAVCIDEWMDGWTCTLVTSKKKKKNKHHSCYCFPAREGTVVFGLAYMYSIVLLWNFRSPTNEIAHIESRDGCLIIVSIWLSDQFCAHIPEGKRKTPTNAIYSNPLLAEFLARCMLPLKAPFQSLNFLKCYKKQTLMNIPGVTLVSLQLAN